MCLCGARTGGRLPKQVLVWYAEGASSRDKLEAVWHACAARHACSAAGAAARLSEAEAREAWPAVWEALAAQGWETKVPFLDGDGGFLEERPAEPSGR